jgi:hypothetical protein
MHHQSTAGNGHDAKQGSQYSQAYRREELKNLNAISGNLPGKR